MAEKYVVKITPQAENSMRDIAHYISNELCSPNSAVNLLNKFYSSIKSLDTMPERVHLTPEEPWHSIGIRRMLIKNYYIYFWIDIKNKTVFITDVIYTRRNQEYFLQNMNF